MIIVKFTKNPDGSLWCGWCEYQNGTWFASGATMDKLLYRMKQRLYQEKRVSFSQVYLDTKRSTVDDVPMDKMSRMFYTKYWSRGKDIEPETAPVAQKENIQSEYDYYDTVRTAEELVVYGVKRTEVARYKMSPITNGE